MVVREHKPNQLSRPDAVRYRGHSWSTVLMAQAYPNSKFFGYDFHRGSISQAKAHAREHQVANVRLQVVTAKDYAENDLDFPTFFDCLHDMVIRSVLLGISGNR